MRSPVSKTVTLVLGGARSGKSRYAQELASAFRRVVFIATALPSDTEMRQKIAEHRRNRPQCWKTVEAPLNLDRTLGQEDSNADLLLIDCLSLYAANLMRRKRTKRVQVWDDIRRLCEAVRSTRASVVIVSNEVGGGVVPAYRSGREYRDFLGELNQQIAKIADRVILMVAGLPLVLKTAKTGDRDSSRAL
jgi:adenosylcobinamide kinase/adenosylcobinamide-phosphate guanylyltransferase